MLQAKQIKYIAIATLVLLFALTRIPRLSSDEINPDGVNWHDRSEQFVVALKSRDFLKTYQHYHPGVTLMWIMGIPVEIVKQLSDNPTYNYYNFEVFHFIAKFSLVFVQLILLMIILYVLSQLLSFNKAFFVVLLLTFEPFFAGNSRILHMDVLLTLFLFLGLLLAYWNLRQFSYIKAIFAGFFLAMAFLTKSLGILGILFVLIFGGIFVLKTQSWKLAARYKLSIFIPFIISVIMFFPALWVNPVYVITEIFSEGERVGIRKGHEQIVLGELTTEAGPEFYLIVLLMKISPFLWIGVLFFALTYLKQKNYKLLILYLSVFYLGYLLIMTFPTKKIDRYMLPLFPYLSLVSVWGYSIIKNQIKSPSQIKTFPIVIGILCGAFIAYPLSKLHPYTFLYTSPIFGSAQTANKIVAQKPFGMGIFELKSRIFDKYGYFPRIGMIDTKPIREIYMNSRVFDIRVNGVSDYELIILGINENMPEKVIESDYEFILDSVVRINDLDYWEIYVKSPKK